MTGAPTSPTTAAMPATCCSRIRMRPGGGFEASFWGPPFRVFAPSEITALDVVVEQEIMAQRHGDSFRAVGDANLMRSSAISNLAGSPGPSNPVEIPGYRVPRRNVWQGDGPSGCSERRIEGRPFPQSSRPEQICRVQACGSSRSMPVSSDGSPARGGFAPATEQVRAATRAAKAQASVTSWRLSRSSRPPRWPSAASRCSRPAVKESPAPTVSTTLTAGAGTVTRRPSREATREPRVMTTRRAPAACQVSQASSGLAPRQGGAGRGRPR